MFFAPDVAGQVYPSKPIRLIVASAPGTPPDLLGRITAQKLTEGLGQQVVVEDRPGAGGTLGTAAGASAPPDGYTLTLGSTGFLAVAPAIYPHVGYDARKSFAPITLIATSCVFLTVHPSVPADTVKDFIDFARSHPGQLNYGSPGNGTVVHITMEMFKSATGINLVHIPHKGSHFPALVAGQVQATFENPVTFGPYVRAGGVRLLAVANATRHANYPQVPTFTEAGVAGMELPNWFGLMAPRGTPFEIIARLNAEMHKALATKEMRDTLAKLGADPAGTTPEQFATFIADEVTRWSRVVKLSGAKLE